MPTRREIIAATVGVGAGVIGWTGGSAIHDGLRSTDLRYVIVRNATDTTQSVTVLFEADEEPIFWKSYDLDAGDTVELDDFPQPGTYRLFVQWNEMTPSQRLATGTRAVAIVLTSAFGGDVYIQDEPYSYLSSSQNSGAQNNTTSTE
ncbi:hypothetical protein [Halorubrum sp. FL23]|uniref:hypothetical protein n=1 Tax=Halorubrum sp. FL23 TaxID=3458704 RepID=UPI004034BB9C